MTAFTRGSTRARVLALAALAMLAFAANSLLCRLALATTAIDATTFTGVRLVAGAVVLLIVVRWRSGTFRVGGSWPSAAALFVYAAAFSFAYQSLSASTGALLLFGAVQVTMIGCGLWSGERLQTSQTAGLATAIAGLVMLLWPGLAAPPPLGAGLMLAAGVAWGIYSLRGRGTGDAVAATAGNFTRAVPFAVVLAIAMMTRLRPDAMGLLYAMASGAITSGLGYVVWYAALRGLAATTAATLQLSVPVVTALAAVPLLGERITPRLVLAAVAVLGGIALVVLASPPRAPR